MSAQLDMAHFAEPSQAASDSASVTADKSSKLEAGTNLAAERKTPKFELDLMIIALVNI